MVQPEIENMFSSGKTAHLVGIGGVSMCSLCENLLKAEIHVTGSDTHESDNVKALRKKGVEIFLCHSPENIKKAGYIIRTAAVHDDNPEIAAALAAGIPVYERAEAFGAIMARCKNAVCVAGTHGKTTTTSMLTCIALAAEKDPSVMLGGVLGIIGGGCRTGNGDLYIAEACEYRNSFLNFRPTEAVILNVDADHLDFFSGIEDVKKSFRIFAELVPEKNGTVVANADDRNTVDCIKNINRRVLTFGFSETADVQAVNFRLNKCLASFDIAFPDAKLDDIKLLVPGRHNCLNALGAAAAAYACGIPLDAIKRGLESFTGVGRRFEYKGQYSGAMIYDDYAHHPNELKALFDSALEMDYNRVIAVFQPHTYTRTKALFPDFVKQLSRPDKLILAEIYAAREQNTLGVSSADLAREIPEAEVISDYGKITDRLCELAKPGDLIITVGAGEMDQISAALAARGKTQ